MKILFATGIYPPDIGGPATYVHRLAMELQNRGYEVKIITYADKNSFQFSIPNFQTNSKSQIVKISRSYPAGLRHFIYFLRILWLARSVDVIYAQNVTSAGLPALLVAKILRKRFVLKIVGNAAWEQKKNYLKPIQRFVVKGADKIIVPSQYVKKMAASWGAEESKINVVYNAVENGSQPDISKEEAKKEIGIEGDIILSVGRPVPWKGFDDLRAVMPDLLNENPNFKLVIVGADKKVPHEQMPLYYRAADIFVLNSGYEGLSHVILEAMNFGAPVIASREGGNPELIEDGFNGILAEYKNREQIKSAILKLWRDKELREKFIINSKEKLKDFTWENLVEKTVKVLRSA